MEPFKNNMSPQVVACLADHLEKHVTGFSRAEFEQPLIAALPELELKQRTQLIADGLDAVLPTDLGERNGILAAMLHPDEYDHAGKPSDDEGICGWGLWPLTMVVGQHGLAEFEGSLDLLKLMTKRGTAEFDIRPYLDADQDRALAIITTWAHDENYHVRRLASEGTRPRLPWGMQLKQLVRDPTPTLPLLKIMRDDAEEYVRRSVANHLNDIAKDHPDLVADLATHWITDASKDRRRLLRHACRTLIKQGHAKALLAFGVAPPRLATPILSISTPQIEMGGVLEFAITLKSASDEEQEIALDYLVHFQKANGSLSPKVFKWKQFKLKAGEQVQLSRTHAIRPITTRKYYPGHHALSLRINGEDFGLETFDLSIDV